VRESVRNNLMEPGLGLSYEVPACQVIAGSEGPTDETICVPLLKVFAASSI